MFVIKRLPGEQVEPRFLASSAIEAIGYQVPIDVVEIGQLRPATAQSTLKIPASVANANRNYAEGTAGAIVQGPGGDVMLSCAHVLADLNDPNAKDIVHPANRSPSVTSRVVAKLFDYRLKMSQINDIDAGIAELMNCSAPRSQFNGARDSVVNELVRKDGVATGPTLGEMNQLSVKAPGLAFPPWGRADFQNVHVVDPRAGGVFPPMHDFADGGDSGSVVESDPGGEAVGLIFYLSYRYRKTLICSSKTIESLLRISF